MKIVKHGKKNFEDKIVPASTFCLRPQPRMECGACVKVTTLQLVQYLVVGVMSV